jgi:hypothetical protein
MDPQSRCLHFLSFLSDVVFLITWTTVVEDRNATGAADFRSRGLHFLSFLFDVPSLLLGRQAVALRTLRTHGATWPRSYA